MPKFTVAETRREVVIYEIDAENEADAENRYLHDGSEVDSYLCDEAEVEVTEGSYE